MELKNLPFSDQFPFCVSPKRKVLVSRCGLVVMASFIVLSLVLFNISFNGPFVNTITTFLSSWPFSFSTYSTNSTSVVNVNEEIGSNHTFMSYNGQIIASENHNFSGFVRNSSINRSSVASEIPGISNQSVDISEEIGSNDTFMSYNGQVIASENHNFSGFVRNSSINGSSVASEIPGISNQLVDISEEIGSNGTFMSYNGQVIALDNHNFSGYVRNSSINGSSVASDMLGISVGQLAEIKNQSVDISEEIGSSNDTFMGYNGQVIDSKNRNFSGYVRKSTINGSSIGISIGQFAEMKNQSVEGNNLTIGHNDLRVGKGGNGIYKECDLFDGRWVRDDTKPYYPAGSCPYIDRDFHCYLNKRPDDGYVKWKWQPNGCDMPSLNATDFLERLRGKKVVFVGDSLNRNMWESLVCILRHSVQNKEHVYEISGRTEFKKKGFYAFRFEDYNCTVDFVGSPFLVQESFVDGKNETLRLDLMDQTTSMYHDADVLIFNTGHWWTHEKTSRGEDYYQEGNHIYPRLKVLEAYKRALGTWARWIDTNIDSNKTQVIFRGYSATHFWRGEWNSGGQCHKETEPIMNGNRVAKYPSKMRALDYVIRDMKTPVIYLNISRLTAYRKDGHPSVYRMAYKTVEEQVAAQRSQDCSHWCLPGVPDTWNELLYASLLKVGSGSWRS